MTLQKPISPTDDVKRRNALARVFGLLVQLAERQNEIKGFEQNDDPFDETGTNSEDRLSRKEGEDP